MKKSIILFTLCTLALLAGCHSRKSPYNRISNSEDYEQFLGKYVFAACENIEQPNALYSLATLLKRPANNDPRYKIKFENGPCKGKTVWTTHVIVKTEPLGGGELPRGTVLLRNYWNPKEPFNQEKTDRWNVGIVTGNTRLNKGIVDMSFPRDAHDFNPAREGVYTHNARFIVVPEIKDVRTFIH
ncbi:MAG: hypothetical protein J6V32_01460 [Elusimicrobiaceae bacterium]|nr:hypothetical protein [Elusimicrobiaceae bacterium]